MESDNEPENSTIIFTSRSGKIMNMLKPLVPSTKINVNDCSGTRSDRMKIIAIQPLEGNTIMAQTNNYTDVVHDDGCLSSTGGIEIIAFPEPEGDQMHEIANCTEMNEEDATHQEFLNFPCMSSTRIINFEDNENSSSDEKKDCIKDKDYLPTNSDDSENEVSENDSHHIEEEIATNSDTTSILPATDIVRQMMEVNVDASVNEASQTVSDFSNTTIIDGSETSPLPTRKRKRNELKWKSVIKKIKVNTGQSYKTESDKCVPARAVKGTCSVKCRIKCPSKITADQQSVLGTR